MSTTMANSFPVLVARKPLKPAFNEFHKITINSDNFTIGRGLNNMIVIPFLAVSRNHCKFIKSGQDWFIVDSSSFGITVNGEKLGKGTRKKLSDQDAVTLDQLQEFDYIFMYEDMDLMPSSCKRIKLEHTSGDELLNNMKIRFEESQNYEIKHIEDKIQSTKQIKTTNILLKEQLQTDMKRKMDQLKNEFASQIENLKGERNEVEKQKALLLEERDAQLKTLKETMEGKISDLMDQIKKHNETESELIHENSSLKEKLLKEREEFLSELNRESSSKQDLLDKLKEKIKEQEEIRLKEKQELAEQLRIETEQLKLAKEKELNELAEQKKQRELELMQELDSIKKALEEQVDRTEKQKKEAQEQLNDQMEQLKRATDEDKVKMERLLQEREEIKKQLNEAQENAQKSIEQLKTRVTEREVELATLAADRIQKQAEQSSEVINSLQEQLEKVRNQLQNVESENKLLLENVVSETKNDGPSKSSMMEFGEIMESELQCSICAELFVSATTLNCSHTFCKYCITMWKKKKKDCPICRAPITSECKSLVLDSFIEKMLQNLTEEMKQKRTDLLKNREELESELAHQPNRGSSPYESEADSYDEFLEEEEGEDEYEPDYYDFFDRRRWRSYGDSDSDGGSDDSGDSFGTNPTGSASERGGGSGERVPGRPGAYYGGYGRCFRCGARGHWAPGCPLGADEPR